MKFSWANSGGQLVRGRSSQLALRHAALPVAIIAALVLSGCWTNGPSPGGGERAKSDGQPRFDAGQTLAKVQQAYAAATAYSDRGMVRWQYLDGQMWREASADFSTAFARPNKLALRVRGLHVACDGEQLRAVIEDEATGDYDRQMLQRPAPPVLTLADLYADAEMSNILRGEIVDGTPWPLRLLLDDPSIEPWFAGGAVALGEENLDGKTYRRVRIEHDGRPATLWIDPATHLLRRAELPAVDEQLGVRGLVAEFEEATLHAAPAMEAARFQLHPPADAKPVNFFVPPPPAVSLPAPKFGKAVEEFEFKAASGPDVARKQLAGKVAVLAWFLDNRDSAVALGQLEKVARRYADDSRVRCYAVSPLPDRIADERIQAVLAELGVRHLPLLRDTTAVGLHVFDVAAAPTVVVLDGEHRVQAFLAGVHDGFEAYLAELIDALLAGENPAEELRRQFAEERALYLRQLAAAGDDGSAAELEIPPTRIAPPRPPEKLTLTKLWECGEVESPGNILVVPAAEGAPQILVHDHGKDWRTLVELNARGDVVTRRQLPVPETAAIAMLHAAVDGEGRRWYAGGARLARHVYVFDENWDLAFVYPPAEERHDGIGDFAWADFQGDGNLQLCVGFWGVLGLHGVDMSGRRVWSNRAAAPIVSLAISPPDDVGWRQALATTDRGEIVAVNGFGKSAPPRRVERETITHLFARADEKSGLSPYVGLAIHPDGTSSGLILTEALAPPEFYLPLPAGTHLNQIQWVASGQLLSGRAGQWIFAGADSSVNIVSDDFSFFDSFAVGEELTGLAVAALGPRRVLLIATKSAITAWQVDR